MGKVDRMYSKILYGSMVHVIHVCNTLDQEGKKKKNALLDVGN